MNKSPFKIAVKVIGEIEIKINSPNEFWFRLPKYQIWETFIQYFQDETREWTDKFISSTNHMFTS
jgi:hypothetical protein